MYNTEPVQEEHKAIRIIKRVYRAIRDTLHDLIAPAVYLIIVILRIKPEYDTNQKFKVDKEFGIIPKGATVTLAKAIDVSNPLDETLVAVKYKDKVIIIPEYLCKVSYLKKQAMSFNFNKRMMKSDPQLRRYHPFLINRLFFKVVYGIVNLFRREK